MNNESLVEETPFEEQESIDNGETGAGKENEVEETTDNSTKKEEQKAPKKAKRGIASARGTSRLKFSHEQAKQNGLFLGHLDSVEVKTTNIGEDTSGLPSFNGMSIPRLILTFASNDEDPQKRRYVTQSFLPAESNALTIPGGKEEWKVNSIFDWLKHVLNVYVFKGREMTEDEESAFSLDFEDFDDEGEYQPVDAEIVINAWEKIFNNFANIMNSGNKGKPYFKNAENKNIVIWMKLIRYFRNNRGWQSVANGELGFQSFVGEGCIEIYRQNTPPSIRLNSIREAIIPMNVDKPKQPNLPQNLVGGVVANGGALAGQMIADDYSTIAAQAGDDSDMPF